MSTEAVEVVDTTTESQPSVMALLAKAELDQQITTAHAFPRSLTKFERECRQMVTLNEDIAGECIYALPRDGKTIEGPSARLAEIVASAWGNCRAMARVVEEGSEFVVAQGVFHDLERNVAISYEVRRRIVDRNGKRFKPDMISVTANAACSIALRNAVFKGVPKAFWTRAYEDARALIAGESETLTSRREKVLAVMAKLGVTAEMVLSSLDVPGVEDIGIDELVKLKGFHTSIREGESTIEQIFGVQTKAGAVKQPAAKSGVAGLAASMGDTEPEPDPSGGGAQAKKEAGTDAPPAELKVSAPLDDVTKRRLRTEVSKALGRREAETNEPSGLWLEEVVKRKGVDIMGLSDDELRMVHARLNLTH